MAMILRNARLALYLCALLAAINLLFGGAAAAEEERIEVFVREGCPRCAEAERFLDSLARERPGLQIDIRDIRRDTVARERLRELSAAAGVAMPGVPSFVVRGELLVGFAGAATEARMRALLDRSSAARAAPDAAAGTCPLEEEASTCEAEPAGDADGVEVPWLGMMSVGDIGLPMFTVVIGLLDGFNPCSMWVLVMMISMLAGTRDRRKMLAVAGTFVLVQGIAYFAFMAAWLNLFLFIGLSRASEVALGAVALAAGLINIKDFAAFGRGPTLSIPAAAKPGIYARMRRILNEERMPLAIAATIALAVLVQLVELLCTSGFPALYTRILTRHGLDAWGYYGYLLLYNAMYMIDDMAVLAVGVFTLSQRRLQEKEGRALKLLSGLVLLGLGVYLIAAPR